MNSILSTLGWVCVAVDVLGAAALAASRGGDAATRGIGPGMGLALGALAGVAAVLLWLGRSHQSLVVPLLGAALAAAPIVLGVGLTLAHNGPALLFPSLPRAHTPRGPTVQYAFPDAVTREAALAIVMQDYAKLDALLRASPPPDLTAHDERGVSLLGLATNAAVMDGGALHDLEGLRLLLAAGARPKRGDRGPDESLIECTLSERSEREALALELLLDAGLDPNTPLGDGRPPLYYPNLSPAAARLLVARGADGSATDGNLGRANWSAVTYQADLRRWATALALLEARVARDFGEPPGSVLERVLRSGAARTTDAERADPAFRAFMSAVNP